MTNKRWLFETKLYFLFRLCQLQLWFRQVTKIKSNKGFIIFKLAFDNLFRILLNFSPFLKLVLIPDLLHNLYLFTKKHTFSLFDFICTIIYHFLVHVFEKLLATISMHSHNYNQFIITVHQTDTVLTAICKGIEDFTVAELKTTHLLRLSFWKHTEAYVSIWIQNKALSFDSSLFPKAKCDIVVLTEKHAYAIW